ncbi:MAG: response regulator [Pseudomonadota bacterium]|nr:response regulator [Pseudomonadota bacterium]
MTNPRSELRVVVLPAPRDGELGDKMLADAGFDALVCPDLQSFCDEVRKGVGVAVVAEEALDTDGVRRLCALLADQPLWSDVSVVLLARGGADRPLAADMLASSGNVTLLRRPVPLAALVSTLETALRARTRQLRLRDQLHLREESAAPLPRPGGADPEVAAADPDLTEKARAERELERVDRLESVSLVASGMAHKFNNLLTGILGNVALARMTARDPEIARRLQDAERAGKEAQDLSRQLLNFARGVTPVRAPVWLPGLLRGSAELALQGLGVRCEFRLAENLPGVQADAAQLGQVVQNLVRSGAEAMNGEGVLVIRASAIQVGAAGGLPFAPGPYVMVSITDRGRSIAPDDLRRLFDPTYSSQERPGIALPIAHAIIRRHGGHLVAASQREGSTFTFYLPAGGPIAPPVLRPVPPARVAAAPGGGRGRLLVMDDEPQVRAVAYLSLVRLGYQVTLAMHGVQAIANYRTAMAEGHPYQLVFLDLTVQGGMGGRQTLAQLQALDPDVRAIAVTGHTDDPLLATFAAHGFAGAMTKPYTVDDLGRLLQPDTASAEPAALVL